MAQVTIYLEDGLADAMRASVKANKTSQSRWIAGLIREALANEWPADVAALAGAWGDFPTLAELRSAEVEDAEREVW